MLVTGHLVPYLNRTESSSKRSLDTLAKNRLRGDRGANHIQHHDTSSNPTSGQLSGPASGVGRHSTNHASQSSADFAGVRAGILAHWRNFRGKCSHRSVSQLRASLET